MWVFRLFQQVCKLLPACLELLYFVPRAAHSCSLRSHLTVWTTTRLALPPHCEASERFSSTYSCLTAAIDILVSYVL
jgi:hypothetical protein